MFRHRPVRLRHDVVWLQRELLLRFGLVCAASKYLHSFIVAVRKRKYLASAPCCLKVPAQLFDDCISNFPSCAGPPNVSDTSCVSSYLLDVSEIHFGANSSNFYAIGECTRQSSHVHCGRSRLCCAKQQYVPHLAASFNSASDPSKGFYFNPPPAAISPADFDRTVRNWPIQLLNCCHQIALPQFATSYQQVTQVATPRTQI